MCKKYDIIIIGAGPIGSYTAYCLADQGFSVCLIDKKKKIGKDVICAGVISRRAFKRFDLPTRSIVSRINTVTFNSPSGKTLIYPSDEIFAYVVDRSVFDAELARDAQQAGVQLKTGQRVIDLRRSSSGYTVVTSRTTYTARFLVLSTGVHYDLHKKLGFTKPPAFLNGLQIELPYVCAQDNIQIYIGRDFAPGSFAWLVPAQKNICRAGVILKDRRKHWLKKYLTLRLALPADKFTDAQFKSKPIAFGPIKKSVQDNALCLGEAAGQVKTTTGGGIYFGLLCSEIAVQSLTRALKNGTRLDDYELTWRTMLASELAIGILLRRIARGLHDPDIERLFDFIKSHRLWVDLLVPRIDFDYHSNFIYFCLKSFAALLKIKV